MASANPIQKGFEMDVRATAPGLPDFSSHGLNRGLPLAQGQHWMPRSQKLHQEWLTATGHTSKCFNCGRPENALCDEKGWVGWFENRRCQPCYNWRWTYGLEKPADLIPDAQMHDVWVSKGNQDACGNPTCQGPRNPERGTFNFWGPDMRCDACSRYKNIHGNDPESPRLGLTAAKHPSWVAEGNDDVYGIVTLFARPIATCSAEGMDGRRKRRCIPTMQQGEGRGGKFYGLRENTKCMTCYARVNYQAKHQLGG